MGMQLWHVCSWCVSWRILNHRDFATISQLWNECTRLQNGTRVPKGGFTAVKHPCKWRLGCKMEDFKAWRFRSHFAAAKRVYGLAKWHSCAKGPLRSCENFCRGHLETTKPFHSEGGDFRSGSLLLRNFANHALSLLFELLLILIIQKPILHQNKLELKHWNQN